MSTGLLFESDALVAAYLFEAYKQPPFKYDRAIGLIGSTGTLQGAVLFHNWNGSNIELSYYGKGTMTAGVIRCLARFAIHVFNPSRLTAMTSKRNKTYIRAFQRMGFKLEGTQRCFYGHRDCQRNVGVRFVLFREGLERIARLDNSPKEVSC